MGLNELRGVHSGNTINSQHIRSGASRDASAWCRRVNTAATFTRLTGVRRCWIKSTRSRVRRGGQGAIRNTGIIKGIRRDERPDEFSVLFEYILYGEHCE